MTPGTVSIHILRLDAMMFATEEDSNLTTVEKVRAGTFRFPEDATRWMHCRSELRRILGADLGISPLDVPITLTHLGKPVLDAPFDYLHFNLSHCNDLALVALCADGQVGVDLEPVSRAPDLLECEATFCHPDEIRELPLKTTARAMRLLEIWTTKEALLKSLGTGLSHPPESVHIQSHTLDLNVISQSARPGDGRQVIGKLEHPALDSHMAALSRPISASQIKIISPL